MMSWKYVKAAAMPQKADGIPAQWQFLQLDIYSVVTDSLATTAVLKILSSHPTLSCDSKSHKALQYQRKA